ncbi:MAG: aspartate carbamoyltransferase regulatory subunit [Thaumarchaeota archaeon]|nr:aspartate carbamoyltransferase regulatory subunit [Nitrososphaerota archaeon]
MSQEELLVRRIKEGTVLDHVEAGRALRVLTALGIKGEDGNIVTVAMNVLSSKMGKKDIVKIADRFLSQEESDRIALIAPRATVNLIRDYRVVEKRVVHLPKTFVNIFRCPNPTCISNSPEPIVPELQVLRADPPTLKCKYCARLLYPVDVLSNQ